MDLWPLASIAQERRAMSFNLLVVEPEQEAEHFSTWHLMQLGAKWTNPKFN